MSSFPSSVWSVPSRGTNMSDPTTQTEFLDQSNDEIVAIETALGTNVAGSDTNVRTRLERVEGLTIRRYASTAARDLAITSPSEGMYAYTTDTNREWRYDGTNWVISGGDMPAVNCTRTTTIALSDATVTAINLLNEIVDTDAFHSGGNQRFTIPTGLGGDYQLTAGVRFDTDLTATGIRSLQVLIGSNSSVTNEATTVDATTGAHATGDVSLSAAKVLRLEAGATIDLRAYQNSGGALNVMSAYMTMRMVRHIPTLT